MRREVARKPKLVVAAVAIATVCLAGVGASSAAPTIPIPLPVVNPTVPPDRTVEPVVMTRRGLPGHRRPAERDREGAVHRPRRLPRPGATPTTAPTTSTRRRRSIPAASRTSSRSRACTPNQLLGYRWDPRARHGAGAFVQIPFQVDKVFTRYLENDASGFAIYSGADQQTTYQWQNEGFRAYPDPKDPCHALYQPPAKDPIPYFDTNDEVSFMYSDSGPQAPRSAARSRRGSRRCARSRSPTRCIPGPARATCT